MPTKSSDAEAFYRTFNPVAGLSLDELGTQGRAIYESKLKPMVEPEFRGQYIVIDVVSEDYELSEDYDGMTAAEERLRTRRPDAQMFAERIGFPGVFRYTGVKMVNADDSGADNDSGDD